jgi:hypothetical protein
VYLASLFYNEQRLQIENNKILKTNLLRTMNDNYQLLGTRLGTWLKTRELQNEDSPHSKFDKTRASWLTSVMLFLVFIFSTEVNSQVANYVFSQSSGSYSEISGGTSLISCTDCGVSYDTNSYVVTLPTPFNFNNVSVSSVVMRVDGSLVVGSSSTSSSTGPISATTVSTGVISALGMDLRNCTIAGVQYELRWQDVGSEYVFQWKNASRWSQNTVERLNFQIRILKSTGAISIVYGNFIGVANSLTYQPQVGLRGATNADYNARRLTTSVPDDTPTWDDTAAATSNAHNLRFTSGIPISIPSLGHTYIWSPPAACTGTPISGTVAPLSQNVCEGTLPSTLNVTGFSTGVSGITFQWLQSLDDVTYENAVGGTGATTASYTPPSFNGVFKYYKCRVTCSASGLSAETNAVTVDLPAAPTVQASSIVTTLNGFTGAVINWTSGNGGRRYVVVNTANSFTNPVGFADVTGASNLYTSGEQIVYDGTGSSVTVSGLQSNTTYYVRVYEYRRCAGSPNKNFYNVSTATNNPSSFTTFFNNDLCSDALTLNSCSGAPQSIVGTTIGSTVDSNYTNCGAGGAVSVDTALNITERGVWYRYVGDNSQVTVNTCSSIGYDTRITVYSGSCAGLVCLAGNDDTPCTFNNFRSEVNFAAYSGTDYYIFVHGYQSGTSLSATGNFQLNWSCTALCVPATLNDSCASALPVTLDVPLSSNNTCASTSIDTTYPSCGSSFASYYDTWYSFNSGSFSQLSIGLVGEEGVSVGYVLYTGTCGTLEQGACSTTGAAAIQSVTPDTNYFVRVFSTGVASRGNFVLTIKEACFNPTAVTVTAISEAGASFGWTAASPAPSAGYEWAVTSTNTPPASGTFTTGTTASYDTALALDEVQYFHVRSKCSDANFGSWTTISFVYKIGNDCFNAISLDELTSPISATTEGFTNFSSTCGPNTAADIFYSLTVPAGYTLTMNQVENDYDSRNYVFFGSCDTPTQIVCFDDPDETVVTWANSTGSSQTVFWVQDGFGSGQGTFTLQWSLSITPITVTAVTPNELCSFEAYAGAEVVLTGTNFTGATSVTLNGEALDFTVNSATSITAVLNATVSSGLFTVSNTLTSGTSAVPLTIIQSPEISTITGGVSTFCLGSASVIDFNISTVGASWESSHPEVATIDSDGIVTVLTTGTTEIRAFVFNPITGCTTYATNPQTLTVYAPVAFNLVAVNGGQPLNASILPGGNTSFTVNTTGDVSGYQWFQSTNGVTFSPLANDAVFNGVSTATLTVTAAPESLNNTYYRCVVSAYSPCAPSIQSEFAFLSVANLSITSNPVSTTICSSGLNGGTALFTVGVGGPTDLIVWELFDGNDWIVIEDQGLSFGGVTFGGDVFSSTLEVNGLTSANSGWKVRANGLLFDPETIVTSNEATVTINNPAQVTTSPESKVVCYSGGVSTFTVQSSGGTGFQWQYSADGETWTNVANATPAGTTYGGVTSVTLSVTTTVNTPVAVYYYRARVNSPTGCAPDFSTAATLTINNPIITVEAAVYSKCSTDNTPIQLTASGGVSYTWSPAATLSASTGSEVFANPTQTTTYTVTADDGTGCLKTATVTITVLPGVLASIATPFETICPGDIAQLTTTASSNFVTSGIGTYVFNTTNGAYQSIVGQADTTALTLASGDDGISSTFTLPFAFSYGGSSFTQARLNSNGWLGFGEPTSTTNYSAISGSVNNIIAAFARDLNISSSQTAANSFYVQTTGNAPARIVKFEWLNVRSFSSTINPETANFQVWLYEGTNVVEIRYGSFTSASARTSSGSVQVGLRGASTAVANVRSLSNTGAWSSPTVGTASSSTCALGTFNVPLLPDNGRIYRFTPSNLPEFTFAWSSEPAGFVSSEANLMVQPSETTTYTVVVTGANGCSTTESKTITVSSGVTLTEQPQAAGPLCQGANTSFSVVASGPNLQYQWRKDGLAIEGNASATTATLVLNGVTPAQSGSYDVFITPDCGDAVVSNAQSLLVYPTPTLEVIANQSYCTGEVAGATALSGTPSGVTYDITGGAAVGLADQFGVTEIPSYAVQLGFAIVTVTPKANGCTGSSRTFTIAVNETPSALSLNIANAAICSNDEGVLLSATGGITGGTVDPVQGSTTVSSGSISLSIPDNSNIGVAQTLAVNSIPAGATITKVDVQFSVTHTWNADLEVNLQAPNGKIVNLVADRGSSSDNFTNTIATSDTTAPSFGTGSAPFSSTFRADLSPQTSLVGLINTQVFSELFTVPNGNWAVQFYDAAAGDFGVVTSTALTIHYTLGGAITPTWSPIEGLYTDAAATQAYLGQPTASVYARPASTTSYVATATGNGNCATSSASVTINVTTATQWYADVDGDGYGDETNPSNFLSCNLSEPGFSSVAGDCNDNNALINPGVAEICFDGIDNNCDGSLFADCTPIVVNITSSVCGSVNNGLSNTIQCNQVNLGPGFVIGYRFEVTNTETGEVRTIDRNVHHFKLTMFGDDFYNYGTTYSIRVTVIVNGEVQPYNGTTCSITTTSVGSTSIVASQCGSTLVTMSSSINAVAVNPTPSMYRFRVARADAPTTFYYIERTVPNFNLTLVSGLPLTFDTEYLVSVQIRVKLAGFESWSQWSPTGCSVFTPAAPTTSVTEADCEFMATSSTDVIHAIPVPGATMYRFLLLGFDFDANDEMIIVYEQFVDTPNPYFTLSMFSGLLPDYNYSVSVAVELFGSFTPYGKDCSVTTPSITGCVNGTLWPTATFTPTCTGVAQNITTSLWAGEYSNLNLTAGVTYTLSSSNVTDFITVTSSSDAFLVTGVTPVTFTPYVSGVYKMHVNTNASCGAQSSSRTTRVSCSSGFTRQAPTQDDAAATTTETAVTVDFKAVGYPNPYVDYFMLDVRSNSTETVRYAIYDMTGRLLESKDLKHSELESYRLGSAYPSGVYNVIVIQEDQTQTIRMVKK